LGWTRRADARDFGQTAAGYDKTGPHRAQFLRECVQDLRARLRAAGSELVVRVGKPAEVLARLVRDTGAGAVYTHQVALRPLLRVSTLASPTSLPPLTWPHATTAPQEVTAEESALEGAVAAAVREAGDAELKLYWGSTLYHVADLPFQLPSMPTTYGAFRERMHEVKIRPTVSTPKHLKGLPAGCNLDVGTVPTLEELGVTAKGRNGKAAGKGDEAADVVASSVDKLQGGETEALARLRSFVAHTRRQLREVAGPAASAKGRGGAASAHFSTQVSPWLAMGCLSPRRMYEELRAHTRGTVTGGGADAGTNWLVFELLWRDFFRLLTQYLRPEIVARTHVYTYSLRKSGICRSRAIFCRPNPSSSDFATNMF
jgi:deoxyribodipyrimidine photolyase